MSIVRLSVLASLGLLLAWAGAGAADPQTLQLGGQAGVLGEWELTADVTEQGAGASRELAGRVTMKHVGICAQDGPEERTGELRLQIVRPASRIKATFLFDGRECNYSGTLSAGHVGTMECRDGQKLPISLWLR